MGWPLWRAAAPRTWIGHGDRVDAAAALTRLGGVATSRAVLQVTSRKRLRRAVEAGAIQRVRRDLYRLADADRSLVRALELRGVASHLSACLLHGWEVATPPTCPWVTVPRQAEVRDRAGAYVFWADLRQEDGPMTSPLRTVLDCARRLAFAPALAVADSALRHGDVDPEQLRAAAQRVRGKGAASARRVAATASGTAANPFESVLRALALDADLDVEPQGRIDLGDVAVHPDLVDRGRRLVLEADSWEFHTSRDAHERDCERYTLLVLDDWTVQRFTWRQVMRRPDYVQSCLHAARSLPATRHP